MPRISILAGLAVTASGLAAVLPGLANASGPTHKNVRFTETFVSGSTGPTEEVFKITDSVAGKGAGVAEEKLSATGGSDTAVTYYGNGTTTAHEQFTFSGPDENGVLTIAGTGHHVSGTGRFKHIRSSYTFTGTYDTKTGVGHFTVKGKMTY